MFKLADRPKKTAIHYKRNSKQLLLSYKERNVKLMLT